MTPREQHDAIALLHRARRIPGAPPLLVREIDALLDTSHTPQPGTPFERVDTANIHLVAAASTGLLIMNPPRSPMSDVEALTLAAWLVALVPSGGRRFGAILAQVENT